MDETKFTISLPEAEIDELIDMAIEMRQAGDDWDAIRKVLTGSAPNDELDALICRALIAFNTECVS